MGWRRRCEARVSLAALAVGAAGLLAAAPTTAQTDLHEQLWLDYNPSWRLGSSFELYGDVAARAEFESSDWRLIIVRPGVRWAPSNSTRVAGGFASFYTSRRGAADVWELRPWQGLGTTWPQSIRLDHYFRLEERIYLNTDTWDARSSLRPRYQLTLPLDLKRWDSRRYCQLRLGVEGFLTLGADPGERYRQVRITVGLEYSAGADWRLRFDTTVEKAATYLESGRWTALHLRLRVFQRLS